ncbi:MAG: TetR/AcrR family transcriptional regulator C-terminal domain-containing protein, partial [Clostridia bacterium]|nr:TetR/AcrR family transcriptional regulator C-terminal domain-containing protein [Clostridia bacterium]
SNICELCNMSRKSFYYHFKDKEDLVNWIFDTELVAVAQREPGSASWESVANVVEYFYENRAFYRKVLRIEGQNSFSDHFRELSYPVLVERLNKIFKTSDVSDFQVSFIVDGLICALKRWLTSADCMPPEEFIEQIKSCVRFTAIHVYENLDDYKVKKDN